MAAIIALVNATSSVPSLTAVPQQSPALKLFWMPWGKTAIIPCLSAAAAKCEAVAISVLVIV